MDKILGGDLMTDLLLSEFLNLNNELENNGVFDAVITYDSHFFINLLRLKQTSTPEFKNSYNKINQYFEKIMMLLSCSKKKDDRFLSCTQFPGQFNYFIL